MESWMANILSVFLISVIVTGVLIPQILLIAFRKQLFDVPDERKIHQGVVPRLGGIAFVPAIFLSIAFVAGVNAMLYNSEVFAQLALEPQQLCFGLCTLMIMYLVGMADDLIGVRYRAKFYSQIISGVLIVMSGLFIDDLHGFFFLSQLPLPLAWGLTVFAFVLIVNAVNLIDGIDGLASGLCGIAFLFYGVVFYAIGEMIFSLIAFAALGTLAPFFYYNVFGEAKVGKKIFMGDTGALTTGTVLSILMVKMCMIPKVNIVDMNPVVLAYSPLIVPCFDVVRVYLHRVKAGRNPFMPDKCHIHHKLLALGIKQRTAMPLILLMSAVFVAFNVALSQFINSTVIMIFDVVIFVLVNMWLTRMIRARERRLNISVENQYK